jgi:hypothetical protein
MDFPSLNFAGILVSRKHGTCLFIPLWTSYEVQGVKDV